MNDNGQILAKSDGTPLLRHLQDVAKVAVKIAYHLGMDESVARLGAVLHDIGKVSSRFQQLLIQQNRRPGEVFRHEIASLFFISLVDEDKRHEVIEMVAAHHKSVYNDVLNLGLIDLDEQTDSFAIHSKQFEQWSDAALSILAELGVPVHHIDLSEAQRNYDYAVDYCDGAVRHLGYSLWRGLLMAADHYASALNDYTDGNVAKMFIKPNLEFYNRRNTLYPLSLKSASSERPHTIVTAPTGAGKTDFLLRRCKGRVFYTLPFQASINAMYDRLKHDLSATDAQIYLLHAASELKVMNNGTVEERILQHHVGASIKVLTPHQMAAIAFGIKGYESMIVDLKGEDVILDEVHTYSGGTQALVLKIIEVLVNIGCRVHVGTATMPSVLYSRIKALLGGDKKVCEVALDQSTLQSFNRHIIHKIDSIDDCFGIVREQLSHGRKILIVCNQVARSQQLYEQLRESYPDVRIMLIHSRFKRGDRGVLEHKLTAQFNCSSKPCIVVSTQVVEVSLDINFDVMVTECAPIDALIQRFGRINRKRSAATIGHYKPIYVASPQQGNDAKPYDEAVLRRSYEVLPDGELLDERKVQSMLDSVYPTIEFCNIDFAGAIFVDGQWQMSKLCHNSKVAFMKLLDIDSAVCITESDVERYRECRSAAEASVYEIPCRYNSVGHRKLEQITAHLRPFIVPDKAYSPELGLNMAELDPLNYKTFEIL